MLSIIVAMDKNRLIGRGNDLPWHYPEDLKYFKSVTQGKAVLMGYNTYLSIYNRLGKALPNRKNYVLTYQSTLPGEGIIVENLEQLIASYQDEELFIIGGKTIYELFLNRASRLYITHINQEHDGDCYFPNFDESKFRLISSKVNGELTFAIYERI